jgi:hypothetical protein
MYTFVLYLNTKILKNKHEDKQKGRSLGRTAGLRPVNIPFLLSAGLGGYMGSGGHMPPEPQFAARHPQRQPDELG